MEVQVGEVMDGLIAWRHRLVISDVLNRLNGDGQVSNGLGLAKTEDPEFKYRGNVLDPRDVVQLGYVLASHVGLLPVLDGALCLPMLAPVFFIGFPHDWWDQQRTLPIARLANTASMGEHNNARIRTDDVALVAGLSFGGSSGSPVVTFPREISAGSLGSYQLPSRLVGIMSGHFPFRENDVPGVPLHSGLSYFTRSTSIISLIEKARSSGFKNGDGGAQS